MTPMGAAPPEPTPSRFRTTLVRVLVVQAAALAILGLIQAIFDVNPR
jgi:hypothetical protein